jgi:hypothetical membrane protein
VNAASFSARSRLGGALLALAAAQYVVLEAVAASAWTHPAYDYAYNYISDLGDPIVADVYAGRAITSPLNLAMDVGFILQGLLFVAGIALVLPIVRRPLAAWLLALAVLHGLGVIVVGVFHESSASAVDGQIVLHSIGATSAILAGNAVAIAIGVFGSRSGTPRWHQVASILLGVAGIVAAVVLVGDRGLDPATGAIPERIAVYTIIAWEAVTGVALLAGRGAAKRRPSLVE